MDLDLLAVAEGGGVRVSFTVDRCHKGVLSVDTKRKNHRVAGTPVQVSPVP